MAGFGEMAFGLTPYGTGTPATAPVPGGRPLAGTIDGEPTGSRLIDASTGDYVFDSYGRISGMGNAKQLVLLAAKTDRGTSALLTLGHELRKIQRITRSTPKEVQTKVEVAFGPLIQRGLVSLLSVSTESTGSSGVYAVIRWRDLTTNQEHETRV